MGISIKQKWEWAVYFIHWDSLSNVYWTFTTERQHISLDIMSGLQVSRVTHYPFLFWVDIEFFAYMAVSLSLFSVPGMMNEIPSLEVCKSSM